MKSGYEINRPVWMIIRIRDNKLIDRYRSKYLAMKELRKLERLNNEKYELQRDNKWRYSLK